MCYLASEISALAAECSRFAPVQDKGDREQGGRTGAEGGNSERRAGVDGGDGRRGSEAKEQA